MTGHPNKTRTMSSSNYARRTLKLVGLRARHPLSSSPKDTILRIMLSSCGSRKSSPRNIILLDCAMFDAIFQIRLSNICPFKHVPAQLIENFQLYEERKKNAIKKQANQRSVSTHNIKLAVYVISLRHKNTDFLQPPYLSTRHAHG